MNRIQDDCKLFSQIVFYFRQIFFKVLYRDCLVLYTAPPLPPRRSTSATDLNKHSKETGQSPRHTILK